MPDRVPAPARPAERLLDLAMHVNEVPGPRHLMQRVDILRHDQNLARIFGLKARQRVVSGVGLDMRVLSSALIVKIQDQHRIPVVALPEVATSR